MLLQSGILCRIFKLMWILLISSSAAIAVCAFCPVILGALKIVCPRARIGGAAIIGYILVIILGDGRFLGTALCCWHSDDGNALRH